MFPANRSSEIMQNPKGIQKFDLNPRYNIEEKANRRFLQYIVNMKAERSFARDDDDSETMNQIDRWFENFIENLRNC